MLFKAFKLQVVDRNDLVTKARAEVERYLNVGAVRGEIFDASGEKLAASLAVASLYANPLKIRDKDDTARLLAEILDQDPNKLMDRLDTNNKQFVWLKRQISQAEADAVKELSIDGLALSKEYRRAYPNGHLAANFLGFVGVDNQGLEGLELALDDYLRAGSHKVKGKRDGRGRDMLESGEIEEARGASVVLTLDRRIQYVAEKALAKAVETHKAKSGLALVMRPKTGAVVAAAVWPTFDPNEYKKASDSSRRNRILTDPFEPGSTFKVFVVAAALEEALVNPNTIINCENGAFRVGNHTVRDSNGYGELSISEIIKYSSNIGSLKIGGILGNDLLYNYLTRFSFGERTGLAHLPSETPGLIRPPRNWHAIDAANIAFGQGLTVTALQMGMAMSALANDGVMMKPYIVDRVLDAEGRIIEQTRPQILRQVVSPLTARQVAAMLRMAVLKGGTATRAEVPGYPVAGKTGTAQKVARGSKTYTAGKYVSSFLGFAPYHDPELSVMVVLDEPANGYYGGAVATPAFKEIMENALPLLDIPPTEDRGDPVWPLIERNSGGAPGVVAANQSTNFIRVKFKKGDRGARGPIFHGALGETEEGGGSPENEKELPLPDFAADGGRFMPDLTGMSMRQVLEVLSSCSLDMEFQGSGRVVAQTPSPGTVVAVGSQGAVYFGRQ
ncbi:MAG: transpeptidase family protein [Deltaproteobacteria bacterium]|nr:transpeptidase family protein [Deltaproteobacteria bacterium]